MHIQGHPTKSYAVLRRNETFASTLVSHLPRSDTSLYWAHKIASRTPGKRVGRSPREEIWSTFFFLFCCLQWQEKRERDAASDAVCSLIDFATNHEPLRQSIVDRRKSAALISTAAADALPFPVFSIPVKNKTNRCIGGQESKPTKPPSFRCQRLTASRHQVVHKSAFSRFAGLFGWGRVAKAFFGVAMPRYSTYPKYFIENESQCSVQHAKKDATEISHINSNL